MSSLGAMDVAQPEAGLVAVKAADEGGEVAIEADAVAIVVVTETAIATKPTKHFD